jgi:hypothetical protein
MIRIHWRPGLSESGPVRVLRGQANGIGSGSQLRMPAFEVIALSFFFHFGTLSRRVP